MNKDNLSITDQLFNYLKKVEDEPLEIKPNEFENLENGSTNSNENVETVKKSAGTLVSKEIKIICQNIIKTFLGLNDEKFLACMDKIKNWNFEICMKEFIMDYFLYIKNDNRLRHYVVTHLDQIITVLEDEFEKDIISNIKLFNFENSKDDYEIQLLRNELKNKLNVMVGIKSTSFNEDAPVGEKEIDHLNTTKKNDLRIEVTNKLRKENPALEELL